MDSNSNATEQENVTKEQTASLEERVVVTGNFTKDDKPEDTQSTEGQEFEVIGGVACPIDPMERLQCESCQ